MTHMITMHITKSKEIVSVVVDAHSSCTIHVQDTAVVQAIFELHIVVKQQAKLYMTFQLLYAQHLQCSIFITMQEDGAQAMVQGIYALSGQQKMQVHTYQYHHGARSKSSVITRGVAKDQAQVQYQGLMHIQAQAYKTHAVQENKNLALSKEARIISKPTIEVLHYDVQCSHGSAIGKIDEPALWYLASKGIEKAEAKKLLYTAFFQEVVQKWNNCQEIMSALCQKMS